MKNKSFWIALAACFIPFIIGIVFYNQLPELIPSHWNLAGEVDSYMNKNLFLFGLPTFMIVIFVVCSLATKLDPKNENISPLMMNLIYAIVPIISIVTYTLCINAALPNGLDIPINFAMTLLLGIIFVVIGNYLPKCKQSYTVGIKTPWTLEDNEVWNKTHRLGGFIFILMGIVFLLSGFISNEYIVYMILFAALIATFIPVIYSYVLYKNKHGKD